VPGDVECEPFRSESGKSKDGLEELFREEVRSGMGMTVAARRRLFLDMARRRAQPGTGSARVFLEDRTAVARWPDLTPTLAGIPWAVAGAVATRAYMPERTTQDLADAARMLGAAPEPRHQETRDIFRRWLPKALEDLENLIALGRLEMGS